jgi:hypothetical protein
MGVPVMLSRMRTKRRRRDYARSMIN